MNGKLLLSLFVGLLLAFGTGAVWAEDAKCERIEIKDTEKCQGDKRFPIVTINAQTKEVHPKYVCAARESVIEFRVVPPGKTKVGSVAIKAKDPMNTWLIGTNSPRNKRIEVTVPPSVENETDHDYNIIFDDGYCIDPRVRVDD